MNHLRLHKDVVIIAHFFSCLPDMGLFVALIDFREYSQEVLDPGDQGGSRQNNLNFSLVWSD